MQIHAATPSLYSQPLLYAAAPPPYPELFSHPDYPTANSHHTAYYCLLQGPSPYPELFSHLDYPTASLPNGTRSVVEDLDTFKRHFKHFTDGLCEGFDWSNMIVAGT